MRTSTTLAAALVLGLTTTAGAQAPGAGPNPNAVFGRALTGINSLNTASIVYRGLGMAIVPGSKRPGLQPLTRFQVAINYGMEALRVEVEQLDKPHHVAQLLSAGRAWDETDGKVVSRPDAVIERLRLMLMTPHGIMKAAQDAGTHRTMANEVINGRTVTTMTVPIDGFTVKAFFDDQAMIARVTATPAAAHKRVPVTEFLYSEYKDYDPAPPVSGPKPGGAAAAMIYGGIPFPSHIVQRVDGETILDVSLTEVIPNAGLALDVPPAVERAWPKKK